MLASNSGLADPQDKYIAFWAELNRETEKSSHMDAGDFVKQFQGKIPNFPTSAVTSPTGPDASTDVVTGPDDALNDTVKKLLTEDMKEICTLRNLELANVEAAIKVLEKTLAQPLKKFQRMFRRNAVARRAEMETRLAVLSMHRRLSVPSMHVSIEMQEKKRFVSEIYLKSRIVCERLQILTSLSTKTETTFSQTTAMAHEEKEFNKKRRVIPTRPEGDNNVPQADPDGFRNAFVNNAKPLKEYDKNALDQFLLPSNSNLNAVARVYQRLFEKACFLRREDDFEGKSKFYKTMMAKSITYLDRLAEDIRCGKMTQERLKELLAQIDGENNDEGLVKKVNQLQVLRSYFKDPKGQEPEPIPDDWEEDDWQKLSTEEKKRKVQTCLEKELMPSLLWLPGPTAQESHGAHCIIESLLQAISECFAESVLKDANECTPLEGSIGRERKKAGQDRPNRSAATTLFKRGRYQKQIWDDIWEVTGEWKPFQRLVSSIFDNVDQGLNQGLAHSAKALLPALSLGSGCAGHCTFLLGTMLHVQVNRLVLTDPGTPEVALTLERSKFLPLVSESCYNRCVASDNRHPEETASFKKILYTNCLSGNHGIAAFAKVLNSPHGTIFGLEHPCLGLTKLLGSGTFGVVLATNKEDQVLKLSRFGQMHDLLHEVKILKHLKELQGREVSEGSEHVVSLVDFGYFKMIEKFIDLPALTLTPKGRSPPHDLQHHPEQFAKIAKDLQAGLSFLHECSLTHNDISCRNFVLVGVRAVIIDLACAESLDTMMRGFVGTPDFVHDDIHVATLGWWTAKSYDLAALAFTLCTLWNSGKTPWRPISEPRRTQPTQELLLGRKQITLQILDRHKGRLGEDFISSLKDAVQQSTPVRFCKCQEESTCDRSSGCKCDACSESCSCKGRCAKRRTPKVSITTITKDDFSRKDLEL